MTIDNNLKFSEFDFENNPKLCQLIAENYYKILGDFKGDKFSRLDIHLKFYLHVKNDLLNKEIKEGHKGGRSRFFNGFTTKEKIAAAELIENIRKLETPEERVNCFFNTKTSQEKRIRDAAQQGTLGQCVKKFVEQLHKEQKIILQQKFAAIEKKSNKPPL